MWEFVAGPVGTNGNEAVTLLAAQTTQRITRIRIVNEGTVGGFLSYDGETLWHRLPAQSVYEDDKLGINNTAIQIKRTADGSDLTDVYISAG